MIDRLKAGARVSMSASVESSEKGTNGRNEAAPTSTFQAQIVRELSQVSLVVAGPDCDS